MKHLLLFPIFLLAIFSTISAQSPAGAPAAPAPAAPVAPVAPAPGPAGPPNISAILTKSGQFSTFIRLLQSTQEADQINQQLNNSNNGQGLTILAPTDSAFSNLASGTLNSLSDEEKTALIQFHIIPTGLSPSQFQTASNPIRTQAGDTNAGDFPLNVTTTGSIVNITTGINNASVSNPAYTDGQLYVYSVDQVLLPWKLFGAPVPTMAPAPSPPKPKKAKNPADSTNVDTTAVPSRGLNLRDLNKVSLGVSVMVAFLFMAAMS